MSAANRPASPTGGESAASGVDNVPSGAPHAASSGVQGGDAAPSRALIVAGPTCSGKSALALALARHVGGTVINADSMQVYRDLRVLTARPTPAEEAEVPHRLYGVLPASETGSVAWWRNHALAAMEEAWASDRLPILCGGTGLYLRALTHGLSLVPPCPEDIRTAARELMAREGPRAMHARLAECDPDMAAKLRAEDSQRITRAWEVWQATGRSLAWWQAQPGLPPADCRFAAIRLLPDRAVLRARIAARFEAMLARGAVKEVRALLAQRLDPALPAMRAHGVPEIAAMLAGDLTIGEAARRAIVATGQYTKRQATWLAHHDLAAENLTCTRDACFSDADFSDFTQFLERNQSDIISFITQRG
ncbi:tRNA (adenosine(37)-N6)-dimethylallyltransferase MiaA [Acetobacter sp. TBRC 12305]|uniref:tRNA dimethylallyltransferase n=2 Tax=Acetobacter garciniae TaxID=2817435 RepID=A0A939HPM4_9PROT|nr:tRNA (adenosine(37)-N6)-dimethylallyltransferase MiaA [Acetobacter garciniae]MBX0346154.1 tRNA (adenosine(37)-N6)-dimethylallyltransferase MiaA [Acetobacter garciniae]